MRGCPGTGALTSIDKQQLNRRKPINIEEYDTFREFQCISKGLRKGPQTMTHREVQFIERQYINPTIRLRNMSQKDKL
jgi:hypothetical protein